jgi:hypothetical protein
VLQQLVADIGPIVGVVLVVGLAWQLVVTTRRGETLQVVTAH